MLSKRQYPHLNRKQRRSVYSRKGEAYGRCILIDKDWKRTRKLSRAVTWFQATKGRWGSFA